MAAASVGTAAAGAADPLPAFVTDACQRNPWIIAFEEGRADLSDFARARLDKLASAWREDNGAVLASGRVDGTEEGRDPGLIPRRLEVVTKALTARGIPAAAIWPRDDGGDHGVVPNEPGMSEQQNRVVWVLLSNGGAKCARNMNRAYADWARRNCLPPHPKASRADCDGALAQIE